MNKERNTADLWTATAEAAREAKVLRFRPDPSPCPGDTYVFYETAEYPVEWTIVERDPSDVRRLLVVPLDDYPQIGSPDVGLQAREPGRVAHIRCDRDIWLDASRFSTELRTGELPAESVVEILQKRQAITAGTLASSLLEEKVDGDPEYRRWKDETLTNAVSALEKPVTVLDEPVPSKKPWGKALALAATVLMTMSVFWSALADRDQKITQLRQELAESPSGVAANYPVYTLTNGRRAGEHPVPLRGAEGVVLMVEVIDPEPYRFYGVQLIERASKTSLWKSNRMVRRGSVLTLNLPASILEAGYYDLLLYGIDDDGSRVQLEERYLLKTW